MLIQILTHTPAFVWGILAFLLYRGILAMREREMRLARLCIVPLAMLALSLQDVLLRFSGQGLALAAWSAGLAAAGMLAWALGGERIAQGSAPGLVRVRGSWIPLALMLAIFCTKTTAIASMVMHPQLRMDALFVAGVCALSGVFSGCFAGRLVCDLACWRKLQARGQAGAAVAA